MTVLIKWTALSVSAYLGKTSCVRMSFPSSVSAYLGMLCRDINPLVCFCLPWQDKLCPDVIPLVCFCLPWNVVSWYQSPCLFLLTLARQVVSGCHSLARWRSILKLRHFPVSKEFHQKVAEDSLSLQEKRYKRVSWWCCCCCCYCCCCCCCCYCCCCCSYFRRRWRNLVMSGVQSSEN